MVPPVASVPSGRQQGRVEVGWSLDSIATKVIFVAVVLANRETALTCPIVKLFTQIRQEQEVGLSMDSRHRRFRPTDQKTQGDSDG